jgi:hypothetical protein
MRKNKDRKFPPRGSRVQKDIILTERKIKYPVTLRPDVYKCENCHQETRDQSGEGQLNLCLDCYSLEQWQTAYDRGLTTHNSIPEKYRTRIINTTALEHARTDAEREQEQRDVETFQDEDDRAAGVSE